MSLPSLLPHWLRPAWLLALLALPLLAWGWRRLRARNSAWQRLVDPRLLPHLLDARGGRRARSALWLGLLAYALAVLALAGPSWRRGAQPLWEARAPLIVALDLSSATLASDLPPSRLAQARAKIARLLQARAGGQVGLVAYADDAFTVAPLTDDSANVALLLEALAPDVMPVDGSDAGRAIAWSARQLKQAGHARGDILLMTDHAGSAARAAAADAARAGYRVSVLGLGTAQGAAYRDRSGLVRHARLDAAGLRALAAAGDGRYAALAAGIDDLEALGVLDPQRSGAMTMQDRSVAAWEDQGYWLLLPLLPLAALAFRRGGALGLLLLCLWLPWQPARAADGWWRRPDQQAHARLEQGAQAYRRGDFAGAARTWSGLQGADASYDLGNALAKAGDYDGAIAAYDRALEARPGMQDAIANRAAVLAAMRQQKAGKGADRGGRSGQDTGARGDGAGQNQSPGQPQNPPQGQQGQQASKPPTSGEQGRARDRQQAPAGPQPGPQQAGQGAQPQAATPADVEAQRKADAAQRARMQAALQRARAGVGGAAQPAPSAETAQERERRLADEAWLRRIPDDPGALLRARFRIENARRQQQGGTP